MTDQEMANRPKKKHKTIVIVFWSIFITPILGLFILFTLIASGRMVFMPTFEDLENPSKKISLKVYS